MIANFKSVLFVAPTYAPFVGGVTKLIGMLADRLATDDCRVNILTTNARCADDFWRPPIKSKALLPEHERCGSVAVERLRIAYPPPAPYAFGLLRRAGHSISRARLPSGSRRTLLRRLAKYMPPLQGLPEALARLVADADLVHAVESSWDGLFTAAADAAHASRKPFVATPLMHLGDERVRAHFQMLHQVDAYRSADAVLALSQREADEYLRLNVLAGKVHLLSMGIERRPDENVAAEDCEDFRQELGVTGPLVAFIGANTYDKGAFALALAAAQLSDAGTPVTIVYAGSGREGLDAFMGRQPEVVRNALNRWTRVLGVIDEATKHRLLAACDMFALPSQVDTFGIVLLEAWSHGKPVIAARAGGIPDLVRDEVDGLLAPFGDVSALAHAIARLVSTPDLASRLGVTGQERVLQEFTWDRTYLTLLSIYDAAVKDFRP